jgi:hypothetical protein
MKNKSLKIQNKATSCQGENPLFFWGVFPLAIKKFYCIFVEHF